jgi:diaminopimelate epimerase
MNALPFWKLQSIGNDFVLVEAEVLRTLGLEPSDITPALSHRRFGVGSDGLLVVELTGNDLRLRMFNPDGSEDFCGNGLRCAVQFATEVLGLQSEFAVQHLGRSVHAERRFDGSIRTEIGRASYAPADVPHLHPGEFYRSEIVVDGEAHVVSCLSTGSTHTILEVNGYPEDGVFLSLSPKLENHPLFPERTSVMWVWNEGPDALAMRIWERGAGETLGCGTGSTAAAVHAMRVRGAGGTISVRNPGGAVEVSAESYDSDLAITGFAEITFSGEFSLRTLMAPVAAAHFAEQAGTTG